ncbi:hypothetical protein V6N13_146139 [Hibiscus sabdariffa]
MAIWKVALALAAGCAAILKPSELSSVYAFNLLAPVFMTCLELGEVCREVDLPAGVLNILPGLGPEAGAPLACHPHVDKLPTIITDVNTSMQIWREEVFEPVLCIKTFTSEEEATELTNDTHYGLGGAVVSKDIERYDRALQLGAVWANCSQPCSMVWLWNGQGKCHVMPTIAICHRFRTCYSHTINYTRPHYVAGSHRTSATLNSK